MIIYNKLQKLHQKSILPLPPFIRAQGKQLTAEYKHERGPQPPTPHSQKKHQHSLTLGPLALPPSGQLPATGAKSKLRRECKVCRDNIASKISGGRASVQDLRNPTLPGTLLFHISQSKNYITQQFAFHIPFCSLRS
ncbi:hypothetical protein PoB_002876700 [Plakobranchus ocellatus]|uniref:Uncharacterized protein n=1 Tax=Plakobranchus ocellatus TaxID=259542 RepID=A0AAV4A5X5_9GAST|nr:hypothetical protein PoB_002876700 [Plakobranchus ocellatus]